MTPRLKQTQATRTYHAPRRTAAAAETRRAILRAAKVEFEARGWGATTMRSIAMSAGVSPKTLEALFATKPALLEATLLAALGSDAANSDTGDRAILRPEAVLELRAEAIREIEAAADAATMLEHHSALVSEINARAARLCWALETAVPSDERLAEISARMTEVVLFGARWLADVVLGKPGVRADLTLREAEETFLVAIDWNTYRTLTAKGDMRQEDVEAWVMRYYRHLLLA
jgi:AcrR family transcriptional regulator